MAKALIHVGVSLRSFGAFALFSSVVGFFGGAAIGFGLWLWGLP